MSYTPDPNSATARRWFPRKPLTDKHSNAHIMFPVMYDGGVPKCLCRLCSPSYDARDEENLQCAYVKALELYLSALAYTLPTRGRF